MSDEISWEEEGGNPPSQTSQPLDLPEGPGLVIGYPQAADWVKAPPELGGGKLYIKCRRKIGNMKCPVSGCANEYLEVLELEQDIGVSCCPTCGQYGWFRYSSLNLEGNE